MPGMTMPFKVKDAALLQGRAPGDLIRATLVVEDAQGYLKAIERTGHAPVTERPAAHPPVAMLEPGDEVPDVALIDESGATRRLSEWRGRTLAITFIYTRCPLPDFCPLMDRQFADVQQIVTDDEACAGASTCCRSASIRRTTRPPSWPRTPGKWGRRRRPGAS